MKRYLVALLLLCGCVHGQAARFDGVAETTISVNGTTVTAPAPAAVITVCAYPAVSSSGWACTNKVSVCTDITAAICSSSAPTNPVTANVHGNFGFWVAGGVNQYMVCPASGSCRGSYNALVPWGISGGVIASRSPRLSGALNITGGTLPEKKK
jgi:hypothetical protein